MKRLVWFAAAAVVGGCSPGGSPINAVSTQGGALIGRAVVQPVDVVAKVSRFAATDLVQDTLDYSRGQRATLRLTDQDDFVPLAEHVGMDGLQHVRLQQTHQGIKVFGSDVVVHSTADQFESVNGNLTVALRGLDLVPVLDEGTALASAKADYAKKAQAGEPLAYDREASELVILPLEGGTARLAWHTTFHTELQAGVQPGLWHYFIDAHDGTLIQQYNGLHTATVVEANGPGGNAKVSRTWSDLDVVQSGTSYQMNTDQFQTINLNHKTSGGTTVSSTSLTFSDAAINDAHGFAEVTVHMLKDWFGYNSINNKGLKIVSKVHYSNSYENAFWDGSSMNYGDGASYFYEMSGALDVVAHEIDHGFTQYHSNLNYSGQPGGMNESFSDIAGQAAKFYFSPSTATWDLGGDILKKGTGLRFMCDPTKDGYSIDNASDYKSSVDVHYSSGVMNKAFCLASKRLSSGSPTGTATQAGVKQAALAWYTANANYWTTSTTFTQGCQGVVNAAAALGFTQTQLQALADSWKDVGVTCTVPSGGGSTGGGGTGGTDGGTSGGGTGGTDGGTSGGGTGGTDGGTSGGGSTGGGGTGGTDGGTSGGGSGTCSHAICSTGTKLTSGCDPCATKICAKDTYCCSTGWDSVCVGEVASICGQSCSGSGGSTGGGSTGGSTGGGTSTCAHDLCSTGTKVTSSCSACATAICNADTYCCVNKWDAVCVSEVGSICGQTCN